MRVVWLIACLMFWGPVVGFLPQAQAPPFEGASHARESAESLHSPSVAVPDLSPDKVPSTRALPQIPPQKARDVLEAVQKRHGEPLPGYVGGRTFQNRERKLPPGHYREYDVNPKRSGRNRGAERIVIEQRTGKAYYTGDHYVTFLPLN